MRKVQSSDPELSSDTIELNLFNDSIKNNCYISYIKPRQSECSTLIDYTQLAFRDIVVVLAEMTGIGMI